MVGITYVYISMVYGFYGYFFSSFVLKKLSLLFSWMVEYDCLDTCCFGCLMCMRFVFAPVQRN